MREPLCQSSWALRDDVGIVPYERRININYNYLCLNGKIRNNFFLAVGLGNCMGIGQLLDKIISDL